MLAVSAIGGRVTLADKDAVVAEAWKNWNTGKAEVALLAPEYKDEVTATLAEYWPTLEIEWMEEVT